MTSSKEIKAVCVFCRRKQKVIAEVVRAARAAGADIPCSSELCVGTLRLLEGT